VDSLTAADRELLLELLRLPTAGRLEVGEAGPAPRLWEAEERYAKAAAEVGFAVAWHRAADASELARPGVPRGVAEAARRYPGFLAEQPSLALRLGPGLPRRRTVMFNVHLDTVAGGESPRLDGTRFIGRGAADAKGPAVALLAGIRAAVAAEPAVGRRIGVLVQAVAGEEGGAMGVFGTRVLVEAGLVGKINIFCEPTGLRLLPRATAAATACVVVAGQDAIDDRPGAGHNATVLLGHIARHLAEVLADRAGDGQVCVAGLHTGHLHNRVYGSGRLMLNLSYGSAAGGRTLCTLTEQAVAEAVAEFAARFRDHRDLAKTAADAADVTCVEWHKRDLPALTDGADPWARSLLERDAGLPLWPASEPAFTCDAIWMDGVAGAYTAVYGPGDLGANRAHAAGEYIELDDLERFADGIARILVQFARRIDHEDEVS
jgi:acetylornithine deacetylase/succinyl-diaminopimelate desuccinylase-like protein